MPLCQYPASGHRHTGKAGSPVRPASPCLMGPCAPGSPGTHLSPPAGTQHTSSVGSGSPHTPCRCCRPCSQSASPRPPAASGTCYLQGRSSHGAGWALSPRCPLAPSAAPGISVAAREEAGISCRPYFCGAAWPGGQPLRVTPTGKALEHSSRATLTPLAHCLRRSGCGTQELPVESWYPPSPSFSLVFPKPVMKQDLPVWNCWPYMGRQAGRT